MIKNISLLLSASLLLTISLTYPAHQGGQLIHRSLAKKVVIDDKGKKPANEPVIVQQAYNNEHIINQANDYIIELIGTRPDVQVSPKTGFNEQIEKVSCNNNLFAIATSRRLFLWDHLRNKLLQLSDDRHPNEQFRAIACDPKQIIVGSTKGVFRIDENGIITHKAPLTYGKGEHIKNVSLQGQKALIATNKKLLSWMLATNNVETVPVELLPDETISSAHADVIATNKRLLRLTENGYMPFCNTPVTEPVNSIRLHNDGVIVATPERVCTYYPEKHYVQQLFAPTSDEKMVSIDTGDEDTLYIGTTKRVVLHKPTWKSILNQLTPEQMQLIEPALADWKQERPYEVPYQKLSCYNGLPSALRNSTLFNNTSHIKIDPSGLIHHASNQPFAAQLLAQSNVLRAYLRQGNFTVDRYKQATRWLFEDCSAQQINLLLQALQNNQTDVLKNIKKPHDLMWLMHRADMFDMPHLLENCAKKLAHTAANLDKLPEHLQELVVGKIPLNEIGNIYTKKARQNNVLTWSQQSIGQSTWPSDVKAGPFNHNRTQQLFHTKYEVEIRHENGMTQVAPLSQRARSSIDDFNDTIIATTFGHHPLNAHIVTKEGIFTWNTEQNTTTFHAHPHNSHARSAHATQVNRGLIEGTKKLIISFDDHLAIRDLNDGSVKRLESSDPLYRIHQTQYDPPHDITAVITTNGISFVDHTHNDAVSTIPAQELIDCGIEPNSITSVQLNADKNHLLLGTSSKSCGSRDAVIVWDIPKRTILQKLSLAKRHCIAKYSQDESEIIINADLTTYTWRHNYYSDALATLNVNQKALIHKAYAQWIKNKQYTLDGNELACYHSLPKELRSQELFIINHESLKTLQANTVRDVRQAQQN